MAENVVRSELERIAIALSNETPGTERYNDLLDQYAKLAGYNDRKNREFKEIILDVLKIVVPGTLTLAQIWLLSVNLYRAFKLEETGSITGTTTKMLLGQAFKK